MPVKALSKLIAGRFRDALKKADPEAFNRLPRKTWKREWCSFCKHDGRGKSAVLDYLARYAFRIAITNARIVAGDAVPPGNQVPCRDGELPKPTSTGFPV